MPTVQLPNGTLLEFPDGMSEDDMRTAIGANFPEYAAHKESGGLMGMLGNARQAIREFAGTTPEQIAADKAPAKDTSGGVMAGMDGTYAPERKPAAADPFAAPDTLGIESSAAKMARVNQKYASTAAADMFSPAADARARQLVRNGMSGDLANQVAADAAARGVRPGQESGMDRIEKTDFDFDAQKKFNDDPFFKSPAVRGAVKGFEGYKQGVLGLNQFVGEMFGADVSGQARLAKESRGFTSAMGESNDHLQRNFEGAITSIAQQIPMLIGGAVTGSEGLVLGSIFVQSFGQEYSDGRAKGQSEGEATTRAGLFGAFEVIGEKFGLKAEMDMLRRSASGVETNVLAKWMANTLKKELPGEMLTTAGQFGTDKLGNGIGLHQDANLSDFLSQMGDTITQTMMQGGIMGGATGGLNQAARYMKGEADSTARLDAGDAQRDALQKWNTNGLSPSANTRTAPRADGRRIEPTWADTSTGPTVPVPPVAPAVRAEPTIDDVMSAKTVDEALAAAQAIASKPIASPYATAADIDALERQADMRDAVPAPELANLPELASSDGIDLAASPIPTDERPAPSAWRQAVDIVTPGNTAPREDAQAPAATPQRDAIDRIIDPAADWHAFPSDTGTLGIPRADMPQIKAEHRGAMVNFLNARGITHEQIEVPAETFKPTQAEFSLDKVLKAQEFAGGNRSILVSADNYVLDGHHQWLAAVDNNEPVKAIRLGAPIAELLQAVKEFPSATVAEGAPDTAPVLSETAASARLDATPAPAGQRKSTGGSRARDRVHTENPFLGFLATHGVNINERADAGAERGRAGNPMVPGFGPIFRKTGLRFDELATAAQQAGFLTQADIDSENDTGGTRKLADMIERATQGKEVIRPAGALENEAPGAHDQLLQEAYNLGIDAQGMTPDQVYDAVIKAHDTLEQHRAVTGAATVDEQDEIAHYADQFTPEETALILDLDADISLDGGESTEHLTDREINELFTIQSKPATAQADGRQTEGNPGTAAGKGNQGTEEQGDILAGYTRDEVIQKQDAEAERAKALEVERAKLDAAARKERDQKDIADRLAASADNFQLGQSAEEALSGQLDIFGGPAVTEPAKTETKPAKSETPAGMHENATAPEHIALGVNDRELGEIVDEFNSAQAEMMEGSHEISNVFQHPKKSEIVRLEQKARATSKLWDIKAVKAYNKQLAERDELKKEKKPVPAALTKAIAEFEAVYLPHAAKLQAEADVIIDGWKNHAQEQGENQETRSQNGRKIVLSLFDLSGEWSKPWMEAGYQVYQFDIQDDSTYEHEDKDTGEITIRKVGDINNMSVEFFSDLFGDFDGLDIHAILAATPCTDFAVSGARHFAAKDADGRTVSSVQLVHQTLRVIEYFKPAIWALENPVGRIERLGGLPNWRLSFDPNHLGDDYTKKTLIWGRFNADLPIAPVEPLQGSKMHTLYGGKSMATKNARSETPPGFSYGFFMANNAIDHPAMALSNKFDRLDANLIGKALGMGISEEDITHAVEDHYYMDLNDEAANDALHELIAEREEDQTPAQKEVAKAKGQRAEKAPAAQVAQEQEATAPSLDGMFDTLLAEETAAKPVGDLGDLFDGILAEELEGAKPEQAAPVDVASMEILALRDAYNSAPLSEKVLYQAELERRGWEQLPDGGYQPPPHPESREGKGRAAAEKAKLERMRKAAPAEQDSPNDEPPKPKKPRGPTKQKAAEARMLSVLGAKVGDTVTMTFKGNVGYLTSGKPMIVASISPSAEVNFKDANKESFTSEKLSMLEAFARNPATALTWEVTPAPVEQRSASEAAKSAAKNAAVGLAAAVQGLGELFGGNISDKAGIIEDFDESKYRKAAPMFQAAIDSFGAAGADIKEVMRAVIKAVIAQFGAQVTANMKPYVVRFVQDYQDGKLDGGNNVAGTSGNTERDSGQRENGEQGLEPAVLDVPGPDNGRARQDREANRSEGARPGDSAGVSGRNAADGRAARDQRVPVGEREGGLAPGPAESGNADRGGNRGNAQSQSQSNAIGEPATALGARLSLDDKRAEQRAAESVQVIAGDRDNITATLPFLLEGQRDDVHFAEQRFANGDKQPGVMFTNGTGTGKTYSGLGIAKRFARQGKTEGVIVVPNNQIAADWIKSGRDLGLDIKPLDSTSENGDKGIIVTTYANFGDNPTLADRKWDWVMADEAHYLMASKDGKQTKALSTLQAITRHPDGFYQYSRMKNRALYAQLDALNPPSKSDGNQPDRAAFDRIAKKIREADDALFPEYQAAATSPLARPKAVFLSATPFAYVKSVDYANGYLFEYQRRDSSAYNSGDGREAFFMQHFGYRMRYNKLTQPDGAVDEGLMARQFNTYLKREGALSGRMLDVEADYQRRFHMVESALGTKIDEGLEFIREHAEYKHLYAPMMKQFDYLRRRFLLEAIKATESLPMIREHLALGRKVAIVHDYKKGGAFNPFQMAGINGTATEYVGNEPKALDLAELAAKFRAERSDLVRLEFPTQSALQILTAAFPDALVHNGDVPAKQLELNKKQFNADTDEHRIIILQSDKGREGISLHDTTGRYQRVEVNIGMPSKPTALIQLEGRIYRTGQSSDAIFDYVNTGTMWERWTFAQTIAERADTAEALAMGDLARGLKDSIIEAFEASDAHPITADDGKGGKARDRQNAKLLSEWDRAKSFYFGQQKKTSRNKAAEGKDYFATPEPLGLKMVEWADIRPGEDVAEPSAGHGAIARWFPVQSNKTIVEPSTELITRARLVVEGEAKFVQSNFEDLHIVNKYDAIVMNPPFGVGGSVAIPHLAKAYAHLRDGGRIVAIIPTGPAADAKFDKFLYGDKAPKDLYLITSVALPGATFGRAGTGAMTRIVILDKVSDASKAPDTRSVYNRDFTSAEDIGELFDELEHMALPGRVKTVLPVEIAIEEAKPELKPKAAKKSARAAAPDAAGAERFYAQFEFKHTKTEEELFGAAMLNRVSMDTYKQANAIAKENGGWYNKFAGGGAQRGFLFKSADERATFMQAAGQLDEVGDGLDAQKNSSTDIITSRATTFDPGRRQLLAAAAAAAMSTGANAGDLRVGKAAPINPAVLAQRVAPAIEKILRDGQAAGTTSLNGTAVLRKAMKAIALTGPKEVRALAALVEKLLPTSGTIALTVDDTRRMNVHGVVELAPFVHLSLFTAEGRTGLSYETVLHEALHVAVAARYRSLSAGMVRGNDAIMGLSAPQAAAALKQFENVWEEFRTATAAEKFGNQQIELAVAEARGNPDEFFVRTLTDPVLQAYMAGKQYEGKTLWARFKDWVKSSLFGFSKSGTAPSWLDAALAASSDVADAMGADKADFSRMAAISRAQAQRENSRVAGPDTMESRALPDPTWTDPEMTRLDNVIHTLQDKQIDMRRVVQAIRSEMGELEDKWNPYLQEELFHGRSATGFKDYLHNELRPLLSDMQARGVTMEEFEEYVHMRHAEEANVQVASINPDMPDKGSGIATKDARDYLANQAPDKMRAFEALAQRIDAMTAETQRLLVDYSLEKQDTIDAWNATYQNYVPLFREDMDAGKMGNGTGQGYSVRGSSSKRRMGSERAVVNIIANIAMARERAIVRGEKNRLDLALYGLALKAPNPEFWRPINPMKNPDALAAELDAMGLSPAHVAAIIDEPRQRVIDKQTGLVVKRLNPLLRSARNVVAVRVNGEDRFVFFNEKNERAMRMAITLKNMGNDGLNRFLSVAGFVTRQFAAINTQYNPIFGLVNLTRDTQEAAINLTDTPIAGRQHEVIGEAARLFALVVSRNFNLEKLTGADAALWHEFQQEGGITGFRAMFGSSDDRAREIAKEMKRMTAGPASKPFHALAEWLSNYNEALENITRMSVYKTAKAHGLTNQQSASLAKSLTVNFNRKGAISSQMGSLYAFFNAAVQGTARMAQTLTGPAGKKIIAGGLLLGVMQAVMMAAAGYDDEDPPEFVKERNVVIPLGWITGKKNYLTIPMPLGFSFIPTLGRLGTEFGLRGGKNAGKFLGKMAGSLLDAFNPLGSSTLLQTIAPTGIDPLAALAENRDWTGKPISRNDLNGLKPTPGYTRAKDTASGVSKTLAYYLNAWTGGTKYTPGALSPTPDQIDYLLGTFTGGVGREILKTQQTVSAGFSGEELPTYKIPLAGRFYGNAGDKSSVSTKFYANLLALNIAAEEVTGRAKDRANPREFLNEHPEARLADLATAVHSEISQLRKYKQQQLEKGDKARVKEIELRMRTLMENFNSKVDAAKQKAPA